MLDAISPQLLEIMFRKSPEACMAVIFGVSLIKVGLPMVTNLKKLTEGMSELQTEVVKLNIGLENVTKAVDAHKDATEAKFNNINTKVAIIEYGLNDLRHTLTNHNGGQTHAHSNNP